MMKRNLLFALPAAVLLASCGTAGQYSVYSQYVDGVYTKASREPDVKLCSKEDFEDMGRRRLQYRQDSAALAAAFAVRYGKNATTVNINVSPWPCVAGGVGCYWGWNRWYWGDPWYDPWYGPYDPWYGPYGPWYRPWYGPYDPWYRPWRPYGPWYPGGYYYVSRVTEGRQSRHFEGGSYGGGGSRVAGGGSAYGGGGSRGSVSGSRIGSSTHSSYGGGRSSGSSSRSSGSSGSSSSSWYRSSDSSRSSSSGRDSGSSGSSWSRSSSYSGGGSRGGGSFGGGGGGSHSSHGGSGR